MKRGTRLPHGVFTPHPINDGTLFHDFQDGITNTVESHKLIRSNWLAGSWISLPVSDAGLDGPTGDGPNSIIHHKITNVADDFFGGVRT